jgi:hypothetical protein
MRNKQYDDKTLFKKARFRIRSAVVFFGLVLFALPFLFYILLPDTFPQLAKWYIYSSLLVILAEAFSLLLIFEGWKHAKGFAWFTTVVMWALTALPVYLFVTQNAFSLRWVLWPVQLILQAVCWMFFSSWLNSNWWSAIFLDKTLRISRNDPRYQKPVKKQPEDPLANPNFKKPKKHTVLKAGNLEFTVQFGGPVNYYEPEPGSEEEKRLTRPVEVTSNISGQPEPDFQSMPESPDKKKEPLDKKYTRAGIRMAAAAYGGLMIFPIIVHLMQNSLVSVDNKSVFAISLMFTLCIISAAIWTIPLFFLFLKQPGLKKALITSLVLQILALFFEIWIINTYIFDPDITYRWTVYLRFAIIEIIRYLYMAYLIYPAFTLSDVEPQAPEYFFASNEEEEEDSKKPEGKKKV